MGWVWLFWLISTVRTHFEGREKVGQLGLTGPVPTLVLKLRVFPAKHTGSLSEGGREGKGRKGAVGPGAQGSKWGLGWGVLAGKTR